MSPVDSTASLHDPGRGPARKERVTSARRGLPAPAGAKWSIDQAGMVRTRSFGKFEDVVTGLGGSASTLLRDSPIDALALQDENGALPFLDVAQLLEHAAAELACPDFGMRLAAAQAMLGPAKTLGPIGIAIRNAPTLREALRYFSDHVHAYSTAARLCMEQLPDDGRIFMLFENVPATPALQVQATEHALALMHHVINAISKGRIRSPEIWFSHEAGAPLSVYRANFNAAVRFGQSMNGLFFEDRDLDLPLPERDAQLYEIATSYVDQRFPAIPRGLATRVRIIITHLLAEGSCTHEHVAARLSLHPRTLQRRLRDEGESFESIKDQVRREVALRHLGQSNVSLVKMTEILGYSETSVLSRSCHRWFSASPRQLRKEQTANAGGASPGSRESIR